MKIYTEKDLKILASLIDDAYRPYTSNNVEGLDVVDNFIKGIIPKKEEESTIGFTYEYLKLKLNWDNICAITGLSYYCKSEGCIIENSEVFRIKKSIAKQFKLI